MANLLESQIRATVASAFSGRLLTGTLRRKTSTGVDVNGDPTGTTTADYTFNGIQENYDAHFRADAGIPATHCRVLIIAGSMSVDPTRDDLVNIRGQWFKIHNIETDPARAMWDMQCSRIETP